MKTDPKVTRSSFFKEYILPVLFVCTVPVFSAWFFHYAEVKFDRDLAKGLVSHAQSDANLSESERREAVKRYSEIRISKLMASPNSDSALLQKFESVKTHYATFRSMKRIAWICVINIMATTVIVGLSVIFSWRSPVALYHALRIGGPLLRTAVLIQVVGQPVLIVMISYWCVAILANPPVSLLIILLCFFAIIAVILVVYVMIAKVFDSFEVAGELIAEADAPALWDRVRKVAAQLQTAPPDNIVFGVGSDFFVAEKPVELGTRVIHGRTLFLSFPLLKILSIDEADATLAHELSHFRHSDSLWRDKISPLVRKFRTRVLFSIIFERIYASSNSKWSREREFQADAVGVEFVSKEAMKRALIKATFYCDYMYKTCEAIIKEQRVHEAQNLSLHLEQGLHSALAAFVKSATAINEKIYHPVDEHPPLGDRLEALGFDAEGALGDPGVRRIVRDSWYDAIMPALELEPHMWARQREFLEIILAWRLLPKNETETAIVRKNYPKIVFRKKNGREATLEFDQIHLAEWKSPIYFKDILRASFTDEMFYKQLDMKVKTERPGRNKRWVLRLGGYRSESTNLWIVFRLYFRRHQVAEAHSKELAAKVIAGER